MSDEPPISQKNEEKDLGSSGGTEVPSRRHGGVVGLSSPYNLLQEAERIIAAIEPRAGATMTLMCALSEAYGAGCQGRPIVWSPEDTSVSKGAGRGEDRRIRTTTNMNPKSSEPNTLSEPPISAQTLREIEHFLELGLSVPGRDVRALIDALTQAQREKADALKDIRLLEVARDLAYQQLATVTQERDAAQRQLARAERVAPDLGNPDEWVPFPVCPQCGVVQPCRVHVVESAKSVENASVSPLKQTDDLQDPKSLSSNELVAQILDQVLQIVSGLPKYTMATSDVGFHAVAYDQLVEAIIALRPRPPQEPTA
jgi:hypothetical protein